MVLLGLAAVSAGWVDAVVGGGGLIQIPALLLGFPHVAPVQILATNKVSSICGTSVSAGTYYRRVKPDLKTAIPLALLAFAGALVGASLVSHISRAAFNPIILVVLIAVGTYTLFKPTLGALTDLRFSGHRHVLAATGVGFVIGIYDGALGPGTGSFLVFALVSLLGYAFLQASAKAKIANVATNLAALVIFIPEGAVMWKVGLLMGLGNLAGGYVGARTAVAQGARFIRIVLVIVLSAFIVKIGLDVIGQFS
ncbi:MAG TPA: TSUP family transporter [Dermatophilaceae bacterium]|nr:TSUP family transporter [Dermatophilaceae bacterium]